MEMMLGLLAVLLAVFVVIVTPILAIVSTAKVQSLEGRIDWLSQELAEMRKLVAQLRLAAPAPPAAERKAPAERPVTPTAPPAERPPVPPVPAAAPRKPVSVTPPVVQEPPARTPEPVAAPLLSDFSWRQTPVVPPPPAPQPPPVVEPVNAPPARTRVEWEMLIGGNVINFIGALALILGMAFVLKYAIDNNWITPPIRVMLGYAVGIALLVAGRRFHVKGLPGFAQGLIGAGIAICYLAGFASYVPAVVGSPQATPMVSYPIAFALMTAAAVLAFQQALLYDSLIIAILGWIGAFLTPFILHSPHANPLGLYTYLVIVNAGVLALVIRRDAWAVLEQLSLASTYLIFFALFYLWPNVAQPGTYLPETVTFLTFVWAIGHVSDLYRAVRGISSYAESRTKISTLSSAAYYLGMYVTINPEHHAWMAWATLAIGTVYGVSATVCELRKCRDNLTVPRFSVTAIVLLGIATAVQYERFTLVTLRSLEALALLWCGLAWKRRDIWVTALLLSGTAFLYLLFVQGAFAWEPITQFVPVLNLRTLAFAALIAVFAGGALLFKRYAVEEEQLISMLTYAWSGLAFLLLTVEVNDTIRHALSGSQPTTTNAWSISGRLMTIALSWVLFSLPMLGFGLRGRRLPLVLVGLIAAISGAALVLIGGVGWDNQSQLITLLILRGSMLLLIMAALLVEAQWIEQAPVFDWLPAVRQWFFMLAAGLGFVLILQEFIDIFTLLRTAVPPVNLHIDLELAQHLTILACWALYVLPLLWYARRKHSTTLLQCGFIIAAVGVIGLAFYCVSDYTPIQAFVLVGNYRTAAVLAAVIALLGMQYLLKGAEQEYAWLRAVPEMLQVVIMLLLFEWISVEVRDYYLCLMDMMPPSQLHIDLTLARSLTYAACWTLYALPWVWYSRRKESLALLICGLGSAAAGILVLVVRGVSYAPIEAFTPVLNPRALVYLLAIITVLALEQLVKRVGQRQEWIEHLAVVLQVVASLLIFELITVETWDYFARVLAPLGESDPRVPHLQNFQQAALSIAWLSYAIVQMGIGFARRITVLRLVALIVFGVAILKIFLYDMSSLETFYRIFSFLGLGLILLATSYLYQRFKHMLFPKAPTSTPAAPGGTVG